MALVQDTPLRTEGEGRRDYVWSTQRSWKVLNEGVRNGLGTPVVDKLVPGTCFPAMFDPGSPILRHARAIAPTALRDAVSRGRTLALRRVRVPQPRGPRAAVLAAENRRITDTDIVLWYVFGIHHITRPEDWPVMPVDTLSFWLKLVGLVRSQPGARRFRGAHSSRRRLSAEGHPARARQDVEKSRAACSRPPHVLAPGRCWTSEGRW